MFPGSVQRTYGSKKKALGPDAPGSVLKPSKPLDLSVFSPSPSPVKAPVAFTSARKQKKASTGTCKAGSDGEATAAAAGGVTGTARKAKAPGTASKPFAGAGWASAIKAPAPPATGKGKAAAKSKAGAGGSTAIKRRYAGAGARTPLRPLAKEDLFAAANEPDPEPLELDDPPPLRLMKPPTASTTAGKDVDLGASASSLSSSQGSSSSSLFASAASAASSTSPPLDAGASGGSGGSGGSGESRRTKRGVPGSPREESSSLAKTTRLFSPVVKKKPPTGRSAALQPVPGLLGRPPMMTTSFLGGIGTAPPPSSSIFSAAPPLPPPSAAAAPVAPVMPMPAPVLPPQPTQQRRFSRRLSLARAAAALAEEETDMAVVSELPAPAPAPAPAETPMVVTATPRVMRESARRAMAALTGGGKGGSSVDMSVASAASSSSASAATTTSGKAPGTATKARRSGSSSGGGGSTPRAPRSASKSRPLPGSAIKAPSGASASLEYQSLFAEAEEADLLFLAEEVKRSGAAAAPSGGNGEDASWLFGFGKGFVLFLPSSWDAARRARVRCLLLQLGFQGQTNGGRIYYRTTQQRVTELRRELARWRSLQDEALASATAAASTSFMALRAAEQDAEETAEEEQQLQLQEPEPLPEPPAPAPMTLRRSSRRLTGAWRERRAAAAAAAAADSEDEVDGGAALPALPALPATGRKPRAPKAAGGTARKAKAAGRRSATAVELRKALGSETEGEGEVAGRQGMEVVEDEEVGGVVQSLGALALEASGGSLSMSQGSQGSPLPPTQPAAGRAPSPVAVEVATQEDDGLLGPIHVALRGRNSITFRDPRPAAGAQDEKDTSIMSWASLSILSDGAGGGGGGGRPSGDSFVIRSRLSHGGPSSPSAVSPPLAGTGAPASAPNSGGSGGARTPTAVLLSPPTAQMDVEGHGAGGATAGAAAGAAGGHAHAHQAHHHGHGHGHAHGHGAATFETPMGGKRRDWGVSARANTDSIHRLTLRFESAASAAADGADYSLLPSHMRYGMRSPPALALAAVVASTAPADADDEELVADTLLSRRRSSLGQQHHRAVEPSFAEMMPAAIAEGDEEDGEEEGQEQPSVLNVSSVSLGLGVSYMEDDANASALLNDAEGAAAAAAVMAAREANLLKRRRRSAAKARRVSMGLMARASLIRQHATDAWRQQHGAGGVAAAAAAAHPPGAASGTGAMVVAGAARAGQSQRPRNSRLSLCSAMGGLSLTVSAAAGRRRSSRMLLSPPLAGGAAGAPAPRISEGGEEEDAESEAERSRGLSMSASFIAPLPAGEESLLAEEQGGSVMMQVAPAAPASPRGIEKIAGDLTAACLEFLPVGALTARVDGPASVCRAWATAALYAQAKVYSDFGASVEEAEAEGAGVGPTYHTGWSKKPRADLVVAWSRVARAFPFGQFLSDGAYKQVYRVWAAGARRVEALSVMDVNAITESGNAAILAQELRASILMSALVRHRICPNHVETYGVLRTKHAPSDIWSCESQAFAELLESQQQPDSFGPRPPSAKAPSRAALARGDYQLIRMELCRHGDLEAYLRRQPDGLVAPGLTRLLLFQMCFALYAARDAHAMRHYDVKLLNFLLADFAACVASTTGPSRLGEDEAAAAAALFSPNSAAAAAMAAGRAAGGHGGGRKQLQLQQGGVMTVRYGLGPHVYRLEMPAEQALCVKLADFGTADLVEETLGQPVGLDQFTTLENTPVDFLVDGDKAVQGYAADAFSLGLAAFHLFTGAAPYEEVLEECLCPKELRDALARAWKGASFSVLRRVLEAVGVDDEEEEGGEGGLDPTLFHTFYRYLVLLGLPHEADMLAGAGSSKRVGPVWRAVTSLIGPDPAAASAPSATRATRHGAAGAGTGCRKPTAKDRVTERYWADHARFSIARGSHPLVARGRARLQALPGAMPFLLSLLDYVPARRPTMYAALSSPLFAGLREREREGAVAPGEEEDEGSSFLAYYRGREEGPQQTGGLVLPPVREDI